MDPADLDRLPPADIHTCDICWGAGFIHEPGDRRDPAAGIDYPCGLCGGTGELGDTQ